MADLILVLNAGSSSLKFRAYDAKMNGGGSAPQPLLRGQIEGLYTEPHFSVSNAAGDRRDQHSWTPGTQLGHEGAIGYIGDFLRSHREGHRLVAVGHRVVHGGLRFTRPTPITPEVVDELAALVPLAPLHQPHNLAPIRVLARQRPDVPQVACFDTAFHHTQPEEAAAFALPLEITARGVRRYGFHGLSYEYVASRLPDLAPAAAQGRTVVAHLGNGASMCALRAGRSIASTMGFTAVDGLVMGTRCGSVDAGVILYLMDELKMDTRAVEDLIYKRSGLLGVSGISSDMRTLLASDDPRARFAVELFTYRIGRELGSLAAALGGLDALVFTGGIGERAASIRDRVCRQAAWLGVGLDPAANEANGPRIGSDGSRVQAWVIPTDEEQMIARHTFATVLQGGRS
ncbi:acetate kinase [Massilia sp. WF1]|uniref:acetate/propionate family kinase n=1 Tax=unclassified Massilia TaxID=2609279 RepID=UPI00064AF538|nr:MULTISPECIES: acetate/propionate family kinase [unclassified Massilia]ALK96538.1 acetate kinase [Massilia sp. WG5]KLU36293.1 acetate kinase [Massilia sp. WF1]